VKPQEGDKLIKGQHVRTKENISNIGTKNVNAETCQCHKGQLISDWLKPQTMLMMAMTNDTETGGVLQGLFHH